MSRLTILIVSFNARQDLARCLESLISAPPVITHEVVVIDNASPEGSPADVVARFPSVRLIALEANIGFARANNVGFRATTGELVLLLNSDTIVPAGAIDRLVEALERGARRCGGRSPARRRRRPGRAVVRVDGGAVDRTGPASGWSADSRPATRAHERWSSSGPDCPDGPTG